MTKWRITDIFLPAALSANFGHPPHPVHVAEREAHPLRPGQRLGAAAARSTATGAQVAAAPDLDRVEEYEPSGSSAGSAQASAWQPGEDFLTLLRTACSTGLPDQEMSSQLSLIHI